MAVKKSVLVIEDNPDSRDIYAMLLRHAGFDVTEAADGEHGLELAVATSPDVILLDIGLPGMDGLETVRRLKSDARTRAIPTVAITAHAFVEDKIRARRAGFDGYLAKPVEPRRVLAEVQRFARTTGGRSGAGADETAAAGSA
ncbi:MAG: response regulator [Longimicrobiales bacterium]